jgi:nitroreductase
MLLLSAAVTGSAQTPNPAQNSAFQPILLPTPHKTGGMALMQALAQRKTTRAFADKPLPAEMLSDLLWAAFGVNRSRQEHPGLGRTAPSAMNSQDVEIYAVMASGVYVYEAEAHRLRPVAAGDQRAKIGTPPAAKAAVTLVYVIKDSDRMGEVDTGFIGQNVYLFAASAGLNAWFYAMHGPEETASVAKTLNLEAGKKPIYAQSVGFPPQSPEVTPAIRK